MERMIQNHTAALILMICLVIQNIQGSTNVARNRPTYASSYAGSSHRAKYAVDGLVNRYYHSKYTDLNAWWAVDLGKVMHIQRVYITASPHGNYLHDFLVGVTNTHPSSVNPFIWGYQICAAHFQASTPRGYLNIYCTSNVRGRYVVIQLLKAHARLILTEVRVYVHPNKGNVAKGRIAWESSSLYGTNLARKACDGSASNTATSKQCSITKVQNNPWWAVDLGSVHAIRSVKMYSRGDCCQNSLRRFVIGVTNKSPQQQTPTPGKYAVCYAYDKFMGQGSARTFSCSSTILGRYVIIQIPGSHRWLALCEVEVYTY